MRIVIQFSSHLPEKFIRKLAADSEEHRLGAGFTSKNLREGHELVFGPNGLSGGKQTTQFFGWDWQRLSPTNRPVESLAVENMNLVYETAEYTHWEDFLERFEAVAKRLLGAILNVVDISNTSLEYFDRFVFEGPSTQAKPSGIFTDVVQPLHPEVGSGKELWHHHRGWFEQMDNFKLLINQNIDAQDSDLPNNKKVRSVQILTKTELRTGGASVDYDTLKPHFNAMHSRSIGVFKDILIPEIKQRVGISENSNEQ